MLTLLLFLITIPFLLSHKINPQKSNTFISSLESELSSFEGQISPSDLEGLLSIFSKSHNRTTIAKAMTLYGKILLYGQISGEEASIQKAYFFFKLAGEMGSIEGLYYDSWLTFYRLDGTLFLRENLKNLKSDPNSPEYNRLKDYVRKRDRLNSFVSSYFAGLQNHSEAVLALGYKYLQGLNGNSQSRSCATAAIYYHEINKGLYLEPEAILPKYLEKKRLSFETLENEVSSGFSEENEELEFLRMQGNQNKIDSLMKLAYYHFYGLKGLKKNFEKAFEYFSKAAYLGDVSAKTSLGYMYLKGLGVDKSYTSAYKEFNEAALKKDFRAKNGLGTLYLNGWGVEKNERLALSYFKEAADSGNAEGQYLYGSHLLSSNLKTQLKQANEYINLAAHQGHAAAMYALGLLHLDGNHLFYSCEIALGMMRNAAERGPWADKMKMAYRLLRKNQRRTSLLLYLEAGYLGLANSHINAALLADRLEVLKPEDIDFSLLQEELNKDPVFQLIRDNKLVKKFKAFEVLYEDLLGLVGKEELGDLMKQGVLKGNKLLAKDSYLLAAKENDAYAFLRLGDFFYYGIIEKPDYEKAVSYYQNVIKTTNEEIYMAQASFNLAYMHQYGLGVERDFNKSWSYYNRTYALNKYSFLSVRMAQALLDIELKIMQHEGYGAFLAIATDYSPGIKEIHVLFISLGIIVWLVLSILRLRQKNLMESYNIKAE